MAALVVVGAITLYDNRQELGAWNAATRPTQVAKQEQELRPQAIKKALVADIPSKAVPSIPVPDDRPRKTASIPAAPAGKFFYCSPSRADNCVVDGDTFVFRGEKIRIADIEAPKAKQARCDAERLLAHDAKERLRVLLSAGKFTLIASTQQKASETRGMSSRVMRNGRSLGEQMAIEGLVQKRDGRRWPWCRQT